MSALGREGGAKLPTVALITVPYDSGGTAARRALEAREFVLLVGGDCPILLGGLAAIKAQGGVPGLLFGVRARRLVAAGQ